MGMNTGDPAQIKVLEKLLHTSSWTLSIVFLNLLWSLKINLPTYLRAERK
jgi:hypothetical protein